MRTFLDGLGGEWEVDLTIGSAEPLEVFVRDNYEVDLYNSIQTMANLCRPSFVISCLSLLCRAQRDQRGVTPEMFGHLFKGESAYQAMRVLQEEYVDFFPDPAVQEELRSALTRSLGLSEREQRLVRNSLTLAMNQYEKTVDLLEKTLSDKDSEPMPELPESGQSTKTLNSANSSKSLRRGTKASGQKRRRSPTTPTAD